MSQSQFTQPTQGQSGQPSQYPLGAKGTWGQQTPIGTQAQQPPEGGQGQHTSMSGQQATIAGPMQQPVTGGQAQQPPAGGGQPTTGGLQEQLFPTQNYLPEEVRVPVTETLNRLLADATILHTHSKFAHWNVKGMAFYGLHELFDDVAETFEEHTDELGERITALGAQAMGTAGMAVSNCSLPSMPTDAVTGAEYVEILADRLAIHDANLYDAIQAAQDYGDTDTADLLNELSREVTQQLWFLEAHLQTQPVGGFPASGSPGTGQGQQTQLQSQPPAQPASQGTGGVGQVGQGVGYQ